MEQKLAAILSADVVGYSRLMADDQEATIRTLTAYREEIELHVRQHRGRLADFSGDNFLAEFPTAIDAVQCAVEVQRVLRARNADLPDERKMQFRIGAHMGDVAVDGERIYGDGVNIAARLEGLAEPGGICLSATVHEQVRNKLAVGYDDLGDQSVKNIPDQVHVYQVRLDPETTVGATTRPRATRRRLRIALGATAAVLLAIGLGVWATWPRLLGVGIDAIGVIPPENPPLPDLPSIVVLPFANMSGDPEQEYFADGITEDLTTDLSRSSDLFVISRNSAFTYKGKSVKVEDVGRELGVRYVLEGSVRRADNKVRITAQLIDATSGFHVWSERYDRELADIFNLQSEISEKILSEAGAQINDAELARLRGKPTEDFTAYEAVSKGLYHFHRFNRRDMQTAREWFERAIEIDPNYATAVARLATTYSASYGNAWSLDPAQLDRAWELAQQAIAMDPTDWAGYLPLATVSLSRGESAQSMAYSRKALDLAPNAALPRVFLGTAQLDQGQVTEGLASLRGATRLDPQFAEGIEAGIYDRTGRKEEALRIYERMANENPDNIIARVRLIAGHLGSGRTDEARARGAEILRVNPELNAEGLSQHWLVRGLNSSEELAESLRSAGLP